MVIRSSYAITNDTVEVKSVGIHTCNPTISIILKKWFFPFVYVFECVCVLFFFCSFSPPYYCYYYSIFLLYSSSVFLGLFFSPSLFFSASHVMHTAVPRADSRNTERILSLFDDDFHCFFLCHLK